MQLTIGFMLIGFLVAFFFEFMKTKKRNARKKNIVNIIIDKKTDITYIGLSNKVTEKKVIQKPYILNMAKDDTIVGISFRGAPSIRIVRED